MDGIVKLAWERGYGGDLAYVRDAKALLGLEGSMPLGREAGFDRCLVFSKLILAELKCRFNIALGERPGKGAWGGLDLNVQKYEKTSSYSRSQSKTQKPWGKGPPEHK